MSREPVVRLESISKSFPGVKALSDVSFDLYAGEVHALVGENGAGKSTLMNILGGILQPESGAVVIRGQSYQELTPAMARELGVAIIHQELSLVPQLSIAENICLGDLPTTSTGLVDWPEMRRRAEQALLPFGLRADVMTPVSRLSMANRQVVEISRCLARNADIIVMDEPTSSLTSNEVDELFRIILDLRSGGKSIVYISHRLEELRRVGDRVTVLKDGSSVGTRTVADVSAEDLVRMMVGRDIVANPSLRAPTTGSSERLRVEHLQWGDKVRDVSFAVRAGEVVGLGGVVGAGRTEIARVIFGAAPDSSGKLFLDGQETQVNSPRDAVRAGIALVPEDRRGEGLVTKFSILTNVTMAYIQKSLSWRADSALERRLAFGAVKTLSVRTPSISQVVGNLSGGNQQKVVIGKWLDTDARVMIFDEPTRGVDVGAKQEINRIIRSFASKGVAVLLISSELPQLLAVSDRVLVIYDGEIVDELVGDRLTEEDVVYGATTGKGRPVL